MTDFEKSIIEFSAKIPEIKRNCSTEEGTKHSIILPFIQLLGYNIFDPKEVVPEVDCDIRRNGDKVDYVIQHNCEHLMLIECKHWTKDLDYYTSQLRGYFVASKAHFGLLTNGVEYRFFSDLDNANLMDENPFLVVNMEQLTKEGLNGLKLFCKDTFNVHYVMTKGRELKCMKELREAVASELSDPSFEFITHFARRIYGQVPSKAFREQMKPMLIKVIAEYMETENTEHNELQEANDDEKSVLEVVQSILADMVSSDRVQLFTGKTYNSIRLDGIQWWPIVKFKYSNNTKWLAVGKYMTNFYCHPKDDKQYIDTTADIYKFSQDIKDVVKVMLMDDEDERISWVRQHRADWFE